jgi:polygalacturonase
MATKRRLFIGSALITMVVFTVALLLPAATAAEKVYDVKKFGAAGDGKQKDTVALQQAIDRAGAGGGTVRVPVGVFLSGALHLRSNITLQLDEGATLKASEDPADFPAIDTRSEGVEQPSHACLLNGRDLHDVAIVGKGTIDGSGQPWWQRIRRRDATLVLPRPRLVEFFRSKDVRIEGVTLKDSPAWNLHPIYCENVVVRGVTIIAPANSPNTDGVNPDSSRNVEISDCTIDVGDDCVAIKSGKDADGLRVGKPAEDIFVHNCRMLHGHGGVVIGSETSGGVRNVTVKDCIFAGTDRGVRLKTQRGRGGVIENIRFENITMKGVREAIVLTMFYSGKNDGKLRPIDDGTPTMRRVTVRNVTATDCATAGLFEGLPERPLADIALGNVTITAKKGFTARFVKGLVFDEVALKIAAGPAMTKRDVQGSGLPD